MLRHGLIGVVLIYVCLAVEPPLGEQLGPQLQCPATKSTNVKIVLKTQQNQTGHWVSRVAVKQAMGSTEGGEYNLWDVDVEQDVESCEDGDSVLETVFYLSAPTPMRGKHRSHSPIVVDTKPVEWVCPTCPRHPPCPSCPLPPPCPSPAPTSSSPAPTSPSPRTIPRGYNRYLGVGQYKLHTKAATWATAKVICEEEGAHLAVINSDKEANIIENLMSHFPTATDGPSSNSYVHVGAQRIGNVYYTVLDEELESTGYVRWSAGEPTGGSEFCLSLVRPRAIFNDVSCGYKLAFICEHEGNK